MAAGVLSKVGALPSVRARLMLMYKVMHANTQSRTVEQFASVGASQMNTHGTIIDKLQEFCSNQPMCIHSSRTLQLFHVALGYELSNFERGVCSILP